jgi:hypothetical protein
MLHLEMDQPLSLLSSNQDHPETQEYPGQISLFTCNWFLWYLNFMIIGASYKVMGSTSVVACAQFTHVLGKTSAIFGFPSFNYTLLQCCQLPYYCFIENYCQFPAPHKVIWSSYIAIMANALYCEVCLVLSFTSTAGLLIPYTFPYKMFTTVTILDPSLSECHHLCLLCKVRLLK